MVNNKIVQKQLRAIGADKFYWGKAERGELHKIMIPGEIIEHIQHGHYESGFATLVATNHRLLLVDKKPFFLIVVDLRYDMIAEVDYGHNIIAATMQIRSSGKDFHFQSFNQQKLRDMTSFIQLKIVEMRRQGGFDKVENVASAKEAVGRRAVEKQRSGNIPMQVFRDDNALTDDQADGLVPLTHAAWKKVDPRRHLVSPYTQASLLNRRRVGRFDFANK